MATIRQGRFTEELYQILEETFEKVHGIYLDRGTSLREVLAGLSAEQASRPVSPRGTTIAAHTAHTLFYLEVLERALRDEDIPKIDWETSWLVKSVTPDEWTQLQADIQAAYHRILARMRGFDSWEGENPISGALAILAHTAYHIGAIRLAADIVAQN